MTDEGADEFRASLDEQDSWRQRYYDRVAMRPDLLDLLSKLIDERKLNYRKLRNIRKRQAAHKRNLKPNLTAGDLIKNDTRLSPKSYILIVSMIIWNQKNLNSA
jgi:hypothetical protein